MKSFGDWFRDFGKPVEDRVFPHSTPHTDVLAKRTSCPHPAMRQHLNRDCMSCVVCGFEVRGIHLAQMSEADRDAWLDKPAVLMATCKVCGDSFEHPAPEQWQEDEDSWCGKNQWCCP